MPRQSFSIVPLKSSSSRMSIDEMDDRPNARAFCPALTDSPMRHIIGLLLGEVETDAPNGTMYVDSLAHALATRYLLLDRGSNAWSDAEASPLPPRILSRVQEKIQANLHTELRLETLAQESGYSRAHFLRMFRVAVGLTPHQYILTLRLRRAQEFLRQKSSELDRYCGGLRLRQPVAHDECIPKAPSRYTRRIPTKCRSISRTRDGASKLWLCRTVRRSPLPLPLIVVPALEAIHARERLRGRAILREASSTNVAHSTV